MEGEGRFCYINGTEMSWYRSVTMTQCRNFMTTRTARSRDRPYMFEFRFRLSASYKVKPTHVARKSTFIDITHHVQYNF